MQKRTVKVVTSPVLLVGLVIEFMEKNVLIFVMENHTINKCGFKAAVASIMVSVA